MRLTAAIVPLGFALGAAACAAALPHAPPAVDVDLRQPLPVVTYWQHFGALLWLMLAAAVAVASAGYVAVLRAPIPNRLGATVLASALACGCALAFPVVFSSDVYAYAGYGDMALRGIDPYAHSAIAVRDPLMDAVLWQWGNPPPMCVYGPAFVWLAKAIVAAFLPLGSGAPLWAFRALACASLVACGPLAYAALYPLAREERLTAAAGIALNPVAIWVSAEGHNDALVVACLLGAFILAVRGRAFSAALAMSVCALLKAPAMAVAAGFVLHAWRDRQERVQAAIGALTGAALAVGIAAPLLHGVRAHLTPSGHYFPQFSLQSAAASVLPASSAIVALLVLLLIAVGTRDVVARRAGGAAYLALAAWIALPNPYPWYTLWMLPPAFAATDARMKWALISACLLSIFRYYGDAVSYVPPGASAAIVAAMFGVPIVLTIAALRTRTARLFRPETRRPVPDFEPLRPL